MSNANEKLDTRITYGNCPYSITISERDGKPVFMHLYKFGRHLTTIIPNDAEKLRNILGLALYTINSKDK